MSYPFANRHIGPNHDHQNQMLKTLGLRTLSELVDKTVPANIRSHKKLDLPAAMSEVEALQKIRALFEKNKVYKSFIGQGYHDTLTPTVILRNIMENPGWYTQYTPYQSEISQGRLEALLNFQTMVTDLTGMEVSNASLLDEGTAAAEAMSMAFHEVGDANKNVFFVSDLCHPQTIEVVQTRAEPLNIKVVVGSHLNWKLENAFGVLLQYPATDGTLFDYTNTIANAHSAGALTVVAADLLSLVVLKSPGEMGADIVVGNTQRFGVPMGFGGPHAAYYATKQKFVRQMPGRLVGVSIDAEGKPAFRLTLQTREQHIRREKATSNICTAQVLLAIMSSMYAVYHGPTGLTQIATRTAAIAQSLAQALKRAGWNVSEAIFDTLTVKLTSSQAESIYLDAQKMGINLRKMGDALSIAFDETKTLPDAEDILKLFIGKSESLKLQTPQFGELTRKGEILKHEIFRTHHSETEMLRYIHRLQTKDLSLTTSMIPLGSCTMKLNATSEMIPVTWPEAGGIHPFAPKEQTTGYAEMFKQLEGWLAEITGFAAVSLQPNAGSQGEYAGLLAIRNFHLSRGDRQRNICLIPSSAHGTNPASAVMAGMKVVVVKCDDQGNVDLNDLKIKAEQYKNELSALMVTYPSTHGVFEESIKTICEIIHSNGGQVYMDGANMNAQVGLCRPGDFGPDVCHLNLHKTFCIPHGGGGPGMGPICVAKHLAPFLPGHKDYGLKGGTGAVSAAPYGSSSILPISWMYIAMMGEAGLRQATEVAILNANYMAKKLEPYFPILYKGSNGFVAHECIIDLRSLQEKSGVTVEDVAKRLMDYGFHAPTVSWPVAGTLMIEPTESEPKAELDRFCEAMISIHSEIKDIIDGRSDKSNNVLKNAPHTATQVSADTWDRPYSRQKAAYPLAWVQQRKFWPAVARINNPHGDRNLVCTCPDISSYS